MLPVDLDQLLEVRPPEPAQTVVPLANPQFITQTLRGTAPYEWSLYTQQTDTASFEMPEECVMSGWLSLLCGIVVTVAAAYLLLVVLRPEKF